ncbi:TM2 domain-containing protein [Alkalihalobacillus sp. BA299]|uniref:TM2 domain-containing protein n=1 Tax=Alkalihalobacillus sp. BA299 TaxID=2815938 RepID=UPI001ADA86C6|nr:TM2 domain-containing protein [Alkalihalobacillus sp. BA299]
MNNVALKQGLSSHQLQLLASEMDNRKKSSATTWILWFFLGGLGGHRYYLGKTGSAIAMTLTFGGLGIWALIDIFLINGMINKKNSEIEYQIVNEIKIMGENKREVAAGQE